MISRFNVIQALRAFLALFLGLGAMAFTAVLTWGLLRAVLDRWNLERFEMWAPYGTAAVLVIVFYTGWDRWRRGFGQAEFSESFFAESFDNSVGGGMHANLALADDRIIGYVVTAIALAAPLQLLKTYDLVRSLIPNHAALELSLKRLLGTIESMGRWHAITDYTGQEREIMYLVRMGKIDFSPRRGSLRAKS